VTGGFLDLHYFAGKSTSPLTESKSSQKPRP
jgi:hypothetical protein